MYAPYVLESAVSFEETAPSAEEMAARIAAAHLWLVAETEGRVVGFAYAGRHAARAAYRWAAEVSVYLDPSQQRRGIGRSLYVELIAALGGDLARELPDACRGDAHGADRRTSR